ncbi:Phenylalanine--tRNA ligase beta subunit [Rickettsiales endosymbiont of Paramecium tredecaurelia]|uniref:phenylalanine--tRNA ligase subunit beta n=1 Tax=Candidatus Sarmatiella mevalonica TaxID=2770581 RepID=UPI0019210FF6|nr:phenylalanine--tRNA ligase subunit beta [Candidatus Sarmatiella mevalonica]MBL3285140.1 Phenylalanine--tRNA ligase beta subunit [Candidatus Sarmatiella mevalonica]
MLFSFSPSSTKPFFQSEQDFLYFLRHFPSTSNLREDLDILGFEIEEINDYRHKDKNIFDDFVVAQIISTQPHPNADKLQICQVDDGAQTFQIICGAPNARSGIKVVMARVGAFIPGCDFYIEPRKIRGQVSSGMLCSESELGFGEQGEGIIELESNAPLGMKISEYYELTSPLITLNIPFNRGDCLSTLGIFRELSSSAFSTANVEHMLPEPLSNQLNAQKISCEQQNYGINTFETNYDLYVDSNSASPTCSTFAFVEIRNLDNTAQTPQWLKNSLRHAGIKSISPIVDVTNYILITYNQPMHAYDASSIKGGLQVKHCGNAITFHALNGQKYLLHNLLTVSDSKQVHAIAGLIGGDESKVTAQTNSIILEAAAFHPTEVAHSANSINLQTSSSTRFTRSGVDESSTLLLLQKGAQLITEICGGQAAKPKIFNLQNTADAQKLNEQSIKLTHAKFSAYASVYTEPLLNKLKQDDFQKLSNVGTWSWQGHDLLCTPHSWRKDVKLDVDLIEEIARHYQIFETFHADSAAPHYPSEHKKTLAHSASAHSYNIPINIPINKHHSQFGLKDIFYLQEVMLSGGYRQVITWSFMDQKKAQAFCSTHSLSITNPISNDLNALRPSIIPNLLDIAAQNVKDGTKAFNLFECGTTFSFDDAKREYQQSLHFTALSNCVKHSNYFEDKTKSLLDFKADLLRFLSCFLPDLMIEIKDSAPTYYHPTRSGIIYYNNEMIGYIGQLHPSLTTNLKGMDFFAFELIDIDHIFCKFSIMHTDSRHKNALKHQAVSRDYSFITNQSSIIGKATRKIAQTMGQIVRSIELLDVYQITDKETSFTISVTLQTDHTFTSDELEGISNQIIRLMENEFNLKLRG